MWEAHGYMANSFWGCGISDYSVTTDFVHITSRRIRAWKWVSGGKEKNGIEAWRRGCEGMKWRTAVRKESGWTASVWETKGGKDDEKKMGNRE
jgi:hypothetical protein